MENQSGTIGAVAKEAYDAKVGVEAVKRAGMNMNLKGIAHEIMFRDRINFNPKNILSGTKATLTKSTTAIRDDVVVLKGNRVIGRFQLKDTAKSIKDTLKQVADGKYSRTNLVGTKETAKAYSTEVAAKAAKGINITKSMESSGISSSDTACIASKVLGKIPSAKVIGSAAKGSAAIGAMLGVGIEAVISAKDLKNGKITVKQYVGKIAKEGIGGGITGAAGTAVATVATSSIAASSAPVWVPVVVGIGAATVTGIGIKKLYDFTYDKGEILILKKFTTCNNNAIAKNVNKSENKMVKVCYT